MLNRIILIGRLTADPELRYTPNGVAVASFTLAVDRQRSSQSGERETDFIPIVVWQKMGELCAQYLRKGRMAAVDGRLQLRSYENKEGQRVRIAEVVAENVRFLDRGENSPTPPMGNNMNNANYGGYGGGFGGGSTYTPNNNNNNNNSGNFGGGPGGSGPNFAGPNSPGRGSDRDSKFDDPFGDGRPIDLSDDDLPF